MGIERSPRARSFGIFRKLIQSKFRPILLWTNMPPGAPNSSYDLTDWRGAADGQWWLLSAWAELSRRTILCWSSRRFQFRPGWGGRETMTIDMTRQGEADGVACRGGGPFGFTGFWCKSVSTAYCHDMVWRTFRLVRTFEGRFQGFQDVPYRLVKSEFLHPPLRRHGFGRSILSQNAPRCNSFFT